ncbi:unnamed protein product [Closterium sp. Yama58-4]|nr:unnamed protein product [Closterium sp. Yama58-4]
MGQCFSSRFTSLPLPCAQHPNLPDVMCHGYCLTDGIGGVSPEATRALAYAITPYLDRPLSPAPHGIHVPMGGGAGAWLRATSAFQIRYAGVKGMVAAWPWGVMERVEAQGAAGAAGEQASHECMTGGEAGRGAAAGGVHMWVQERMDKFEAQHADVDVVNWPRPQPCFLNRRIVTLLSTLNVPDHVFLHMDTRCASNAPLLASFNPLWEQDDMLESLEGPLSSRRLVRRLKSCRRPISPPPTSPLPTSLPPSSPPLPVPIPSYPLWLHDTMVECLEAAVGSGAAAMQLLEESGTDHLHGGTITMLCAAFHLVQEPHLKCIIQAVRAVQLQGLISRAHNFVKDGHWLMVVVDEKGLLQHAIYITYGQSFIEVCDATAPAPSATATLRLLSIGHSKGTPRVVNGPVVFGKNPCLQSGDLRLLTAVDLLFCIISSARAHMPRRHEAFLVDHMLNDSVGIICSTYVMHAHSSHRGALDPASLILACQATLAFDFPKTSMAGVMPREVCVHEYPDFMEKDKQQ